jgi:hypothetical protein
MTEAYRATAGIVREELEGGKARDGEFRGGEVLVTLGEYDRVQQVLDHLELPIAVGAAKKLEPERYVEFARVVLDQDELGPGHGAVDPAR